MPYTKASKPAGAPFLYKMTFKPSELEKQELIEYIDDRKFKKKVPIFDGEKGVEALLLTQEMFLKACEPLQFNGEERFEKFEECLADSAVDHWMNIEGDYPRDDAGFEDAMRAFLLKFSTPEARDVMKQVMDGCCNKQHDTTCRQHQNRFETMVRRANKIHGLGDPINEYDMKKWYLKSYPLNWQNDWDTAGKRFSDANVSMETITIYMENRKGHYDNQEGNRKKTNRNGNEKRDDKVPRKGRQANGKHQKINKKEKNICSIHGNHEWKDCPLNKFSKNYDPQARRPDRDNDGRGRGNPGNNGGSGNNRNWNRGRWNNSNNNNNNNNNNNPRRNEGGREGYYQQDGMREQDAQESTEGTPRTEENQFNEESRYYNQLDAMFVSHQ